MRTLGKGTTGVGLCEGGPVPPQQEKGLKCFLAQKMELSLCQGRISFHRDWLLNNTGADFSLLASLLQLVSVSVTHLFLHSISVERSGLLDYVGTALICVG